METTKTTEILKTLRIKESLKERNDLIISAFHVKTGENLEASELQEKMQNLFIKEHELEIN